MFRVGVPGALTILASRPSHMMFYVFCNICFENVVARLAIHEVPSRVTHRRRRFFLAVSSIAGLFSVTEHFCAVISHSFSWFRSRRLSLPESFRDRGSC